MQDYKKSTKFTLKIVLKYDDRKCIAINLNFISSAALQNTAKKESTFNF